MGACKAEEVNEMPRKKKAEEPLTPDELAVVDATEVQEALAEEEIEYAPPPWLTPAHERLRYLVREYYRAQRARIRASHYLRRLEARGVEQDRLQAFLDDPTDGRRWGGRRMRGVAK